MVGGGGGLPMQAKVYFSAFSTDAFMGFEKTRQRATSMPKAFSINSMSHGKAVVKNALLLV